jgi:O-antigen/teichoic acid export membrane protein
VVANPYMARDWNGRSAVRSIVWIALDRWGTRLASLITLIVLARLLAPADFGVVALASTFVTFIGIFVDYGFSKAVVQRKDLGKAHLDSAFWFSVAVGLLLFVTTLFVAPVFAAAMSAPDVTPVLRWMAIAIAINALSATPAALLERDLKFKPLAIRRVLGTIAGGIAGVTLAFLGGGIWSLVAQILVAAGVSLVALWVATSWRPGFGASRSALRDLMPVGTGVLGIELVGFLNAQADRLLIGAFLTTEALGYYFMAVRVLQIISELFSSVFSAMALPAFSRMQDDPERMRTWLYRFTGTSSAVMLPVFAVSALAAPVLLPFVLGPQWQPSAVLFQVLTLLGAITVVAYFDRSVLLALGKARTAFLLTLGQCLVSLVLVFAAVPHGTLAVAIAVVVRQYAYWPVRIFVLKKNVGVSVGTYLLQWLRPFLACCLAVVAILAALRQWPALGSSVAAYLTTSIVGGGALCVAMVFLFQPQLLAQVRSVIGAVRSRGD